MAVAKTKTVSKFVFYPLVLVGTMFTLKLFYDFGDKWWNGMAWAVVGLGMESLKIIFLAKWRLAVHFRKRPSVMNVGGYLAMASLCIFTYLVAGITTIERKAVHDEAKSAKSKEIRLRIQEAEKQLSDIIAREDYGQEREAINRQISALTAQIGNVTHGVTERSLALTAEIDRLQRRKEQLGQNANDARKQEVMKLLTDLRREYGAQVVMENDTKGSFEVIAKVTGARQETVMVIFLFFVTLAMEVGIAVTSGSAVSDLQGRSTEKEPKPSDQLTFQMLQSNGEKESKNG